MSKIYNMIPLVNVDKIIQLQILNIRNNENIRKWMINDNIISEENHLTWIEQIKNDNSQKYFVILSNENISAGVVYIKNIDYKNKIAEIGFYKSPIVNEKGLLTLALFQLINYSFNNLELEKIYSEVIQENIKSINIHKRLLFREEGFFRSHILRNGTRVGIHLFGLLKEEWEAGKNSIEIQTGLSIILKNLKITHKL